MRCEDCGCGMSGGFCSNCHEEVFIYHQTVEQDLPVSEELMEKVKQHEESTGRSAA